MSLLRLLSAFCLLLIFQSTSFSQDYSKMPAAVQQKMDQNKREGKSTLDGVSVKYNIVFNEGSSKEKQILLKQLLLSNSAIKSALQLIPSGSWEVVCNADFTLEKLKALVDPKGFQIDRVISEIYFI